MNSFTKRKETVMKKAFQLSVLCNVPVAAIIFSPYGEVETFPKNLSQLKSILKQSYYKDDDGDDDDDEISKKYSSSMHKLLNQVDARIAKVDRMIELMTMNNNDSFEGIGFEALLAGPQSWFDPFGSGSGGGGPFHGQGFGWLQSIGPNSYAVVDNMLPLQQSQPLAAVDVESYYNATYSNNTGDDATTSTATTTTLQDGKGREASESCGFAEEDTHDIWCDIINAQEGDYLQSRLCFGEKDDFLDNHGEVSAFAAAIADEDGDTHEIFNFVNNFFNDEVVNI